MVAYMKILNFMKSNKGEKYTVPELQERFDLTMARIRGALTRISKWRPELKEDGTRPQEFWWDGE